MFEFHRAHHLEKKEDNLIKSHWRLFVIAGALIFFFAFIFFITRSPKDFPIDQVISIEDGMSLNEISRSFEEQNVVRSAGVFETIVVFFEGDRKVAAGDYVFEEKLGSLEVARRIIEANYGVGKVPVTIFEGFTREAMAQNLEAQLENFDTEEFLKLTKDLEGYLFPDTYFFFVTTDTKEVIKILQDTFQRKVVEGLAEEFEKSERSFEDIMVMASIIEAEAHDGYIERQTISGILWKRLDRGMRLQVDATLKYINGKASHELTLTDLAEDHEYNTYVIDGLPPTPINSPGISSIRAALNPVDSPYFFYLHDNSGTVHYAQTFDGHKQNIANHLR